VIDILYFTSRYLILDDLAKLKGKGEEVPGVASVTPLLYETMPY